MQIPIGTIVICHNCDTRICKIIKSVSIGDKIEESLFKAIYPQRKIKNNHICKCHNCNEGIYFNKFLFKNGTIIDFNQQ